MTRAATSPELVYYRTPGKASILRCAILPPPIVYRARINQSFSSLDQVLSIVFDNGSGTLADVLPDMEVWIGSSLDAHDKGICRLRDKDATRFYLSETSEIAFADNLYVTIVAGYGVWARPVRITTGGTVYMDETTYTNQHTLWDPMPNMGPHKVAELTGASVNVGFSGAASFCPGSTISSYAWSCATASASAGTTTDTCTLQFDTVGWHIVYLTLTAANGKTFWGVRYVYIWSQEDPPPACELLTPMHIDVDSAGAQAEIRMYDADLADVYDRAMVIVFTEDYYGGTLQNIGPVAGAENICFIGWISEESHHIESEQGSVTFRAAGAAAWMAMIPSWPDGVEITSGSASWTKVPGLTVDLGVYHFLRWRSTVTRVMDVTLSGDTRYSPEVYSSAQDLLGQLQEMTWSQIYARVGVNALNQLSVEIHPSLIPTGDRAYPTVMAITQADYADGLDFDRAVVPEVGIVDMSGIAVNAAGAGSAYFALAPGHSLPHYGQWDIQPNLLLEDQAQVITQAGLYRSWRNNPYKQIPIVFDAPIRLIDCFPNQRCTISIQPGDNVRGLTLSGGLIPVSVDLVHDPETGYLHTEVTFEAETSESGAMQGDTPGSGSTSGPTTPSFPPLPPLPPITPGGPPSTEGAVSVIMHDSSAGFIYTNNFDSASPNWLLMNGGLTSTQRSIANILIVCPNGALYCGKSGSGSRDAAFVAYAPSLGSSWQIIEDVASIEAVYGSPAGLAGLAYNPLVPESVAYIAGYASNHDLYIGSGGVFSAGAHISNLWNTDGYMTYGFGKWRLIGSYHDWAFSYPHYWLFDTSGSSITADSGILGSPSEWEPHIHAGTLPVGWLPKSSGNKLLRYESNFTDTPVEIDMGGTFSLSTGYSVPSVAADLTGMYLMGRNVYSNAKGRSTDGGYSWSGLPGLPAGNYVFQCQGASSLWIAAGAVVRESDDYGSTWTNKEGDITSSIPVPSIDMIRVVG